MASTYHRLPNDTHAVTFYGVMMFREFLIETLSRPAGHDMSVAGRDNLALARSVRNQFLSYRAKLPGFYGETSTDHCVDGLQGNRAYILVYTRRSNDGINYDVVWFSCRETTDSSGPK